MKRETAKIKWYVTLFILTFLIQNPNFVSIIEQ